MLLPKNRVKLLLNMLVIAQQTIPRGGMLTIDPIGDGETMSFRVAQPSVRSRIRASSRNQSELPVPQYAVSASGAPPTIARSFKIVATASWAIAS